MLFDARVQTAARNVLIDGTAPNAMAARVPVAKSVLVRAGVIPPRCGG